MSYEHALDKLGKIFNSFIFRCQKRLAPKKSAGNKNKKYSYWNVSVLVVSSLFSLEKKYLKFVTLRQYFLCYI
jgi:hypothetical protein